MMMVDPEHHGHPAKQQQREEGETPKNAKRKLKRDPHGGAREPGSPIFISNLSRMKTHDRRYLLRMPLATV